MADPKKDKPKEKPPGWNLDPTELVILFVLLLAIGGTIVPGVINYITSGEISFYGFKLSYIFNFFKDNVFFFKLFGFGVAGVAAAGTMFLNRSADLIAASEIAKMYPATVNTPDIFTASSEELVSRNRWKNVIDYVESENPGNWRLAIIEADIMLDELLFSLRLPGNTIGDKLKAVEPSDFLSLNEAWEAHKARNMIAHEGQDFLLNQREARRIISLYEMVFKEFEVI